MFCLICFLCYSEKTEESDEYNVMFSEIDDGEWDTSDNDNDDLRSDSGKQ